MNSNLIGAQFWTVSSISVIHSEKTKGSLQHRASHNRPECHVHRWSIYSPPPSADLILIKFCSWLRSCISFWRWTLALGWSTKGHKLLPNIIDQQNNHGCSLVAWECNFLQTGSDHVTPALSFLWLVALVRADVNRSQYLPRICIQHVWEASGMEKYWMLALTVFIYSRTPHGNWNNSEHYSAGWVEHSQLH